jgi:NodT family efflux transporter outer membrane factor (OMF) lipoprotein
LSLLNFFNGLDHGILVGMHVRTPKTKLALAAAAALGLALSGCAVGPNYKRPAVATPPIFKEAEGWKPAEPADAAPRHEWWKAFGDPVLDELEAKVLVSNQTLAQSEAAYRQAKGLLDQQRATLFPTVNLNGQAIRSQSPSGFTSSAGQISVQAKPIDTYVTNLGLSWDVDLWGRIRRSIESAHANADASAGDLASATLTQQALLADDYFQLREADEEKRLIDQTVKAYGENLRIAEAMFKSGVGPRTDVLSAQTALESAQGQALGLVKTRAQLEHAIAVLVGAPPAELSIAPASWNPTLPAVPTTMPSALLERRPDIAAAERRVKAANAQVGVSIAGYFPDVAVSGQYGFTSAMLGQLFKAAANNWSLGASAAETVFNAGATGAKVRQARAARDAAVASYRQTVLTAFSQVEDNIAALRVLESQYAIDQSASREADEAEDLTNKQYKTGAVGFTAVVVAQNTALAARRTAIQASRDRLVTLVDLIHALGGGWAVQQLASAAPAP